jgi:hypothetical protein|tara:strand:- start:3308 stop:4555 length:1248 start_codon:yes stop_codon:yes gene_type:complete
MYGNAQLIELIWRNPAYQRATQSPASEDDTVGKGALFGGFRTTSSCAYSQADAPSKRLRSEYDTSNRVLCYPGELFDKKYKYVLGPENGWDKDSRELPIETALVRTTPTDRDSYRDAAANPSFKTSVPAWNEIRRYTSTQSGDSDAPLDYKQAADNKARTDGGTERIQFVDDINWANEGDTTMTMDLEESITGANCNLKKICLQFSKENHHASEVTFDFSDITRAQGSISSSSHPMANMITILLDGKEKLHTSYFDCRMGKFGANKFKLSVKSIKYFPPLSSPLGGFDAGSQVARDVRTVYRIAPPSSLATTPDAGFSNTTNPASQATGDPNAGRAGAASRTVAAINNYGANEIDPADAYTWKYYGGDGLATVGAGVGAIAQTMDVSAGISEYSTAARETRGTLLSAAIYLQADT